MARVVLLQAEPRVSATGSIAPVRLAGGGSRAFTQLGVDDWRDGLTGIPRFTASLGFDQSGWTGAVLPQTAAIDFFSSDQTFAGYLAGLSWKGAPVTIIVGDDETESYVIALVGTIASSSYAGGRVTITIADLSGRLDAVALPDTFAGTGDLEGGDSATGRVKRRTWGRAFNIEGRLLDSANNIYEFGDPSRPWQEFTLVKDKGVDGPLSVVGWQGSALATLNALRAASPPSGGATVAPSICCVKWWTEPSGPLTADVRGEIGAGYDARPAYIAARIIQGYGGPSIANLGEALDWKGFEAGIHVDDASRTVGSVLDELLLPVSIAWVVDAAGMIYFRLLAWGDAVDGLLSDSVVREISYQPLDSRKLGFQRNYRIHGDGEISAAIIDTNPTYADGTPIDVLRPTEAGANQTETRVSVGIQGQGPLATSLLSPGQVANGNITINPDGSLAGAGGGQVTYSGLGGKILGLLDRLFFGSPYLQESDGGPVAVLSAFKTLLGNAAGILGQGAFATQSQIDLDNRSFFIPTGRFAPLDNGDGGFFKAQSIAFGTNATGYRNLFFLEPQEGGANVTEGRTSAAFTGQGAFATQSYIQQSNVAAYFNFNSFSLNYSITRSDGVNIVTENLVVTQQGISAGFVAQGQLATLNQAGTNNIAPNAATQTGAVSFDGVQVTGSFNGYVNVASATIPVDSTNYSIVVFVDAFIRLDASVNSGNFGGLSGNARLLRNGSEVVGGFEFTTSYNGDGGTASATGQISIVKADLPPSTGPCTYTLQVAAYTNTGGNKSVVISAVRGNIVPIIYKR